VTQKFAEKTSRGGLQNCSPTLMNVRTKTLAKHYDVRTQSEKENYGPEAFGINSYKLEK